MVITRLMFTVVCMLGSMYVLPLVLDLRLWLCVVLGYV